MRVPGNDMPFKVGDKVHIPYCFDRLIVEEVHENMIAVSMVKARFEHGGYVELAVHNFAPGWQGEHDATTD